MKVAIVLNAGKKVNREIVADKVICADGGLLCYDGVPDVFIGDFDSFEGSIPSGVEIIEHNPHKNATDGTLSVEYAIDNLGADAIEIFGVTGGREDHVLGNYTLLALANKRGVKAVAKDDGLDVFVADGKCEFSAAAGELVSIIPYGGECRVAHSTGLEYPLENLTLTPYDTRGVSNVAEGDVSLEFITGKALIFHYVK